MYKLLGNKRRLVYSGKPGLRNAIRAQYDYSIVLGRKKHRVEEPSLVDETSDDFMPDEPDVSFPAEEDEVPVVEPMEVDFPGEVDEERPQVVDDPVHVQQKPRRRTSPRLVEAEEKLLSEREVAKSTLLAKLKDAKDKKNEMKLLFKLSMVGLAKKKDAAVRKGEGSWAYESFLHSLEIAGKALAKKKATAQTWNGIRNEYITTYGPIPV